MAPSVPNWPAASTSKANWPAVPTSKPGRAGALRERRPPTVCRRSCPDVPLKAVEALSALSQYTSAFTVFVASPDAYTPYSLLPGLASSNWSVFDHDELGPERREAPPPDVDDA